MLNFKKKLEEWGVSSPGDVNRNSGVRGGSKYSWIEVIIRGFELTRIRWNTLWSVRMPAWCTGWHAGVLACATSVVVVLIINISLTIYAATNPEHKMERDVGTLYSGSCGKSRRIGMWLHLAINFLSTLLLSASNYTQQCLVAPTRGEVDAAHARRRWMDIGVPSVRNLFRIKRERVLLWIAIGITSIPLHLLYNSVVYTTLSANDFVITVVTSNHFEQPISNTTEAILDANREAYNITNWSGDYMDMDYLRIYSSALEEYNKNARRYKDLTPAECIKLYNTDLMSSHRNLFLITKYSSNARYNSTILAMTKVEAASLAPSSWICSGYIDFMSTMLGNPECQANKIASEAEKGQPWRVNPLGAGWVEISGCKSEKILEKCKVQLSLAIMTIVICCNLVKACSMIIAVVRSREPTLVTLGDALESFLSTPDQTTMGMCFADQTFVKSKWRSGLRTMPEQWKSKGVQRWRASVSMTRWVTCNSLCLLAIIAAGWLLQYRMVKDGEYVQTDIISLWTRGFSKVNNLSLVDLGFRNITEATLLANLPQTILSFLYLTYNSLFTCMLSAHEWSLFGHHHRTLRVTSPRPGQSSTYRIQIPYTYAIPLITLSCLLHWLASQSIFVARVEISDPAGDKISSTISGLGYSCIAMMFALTLGIFGLLATAGIGYRRFAAEIAIVGSCSAAISAACHTLGEDSEAIIGKELRWGDVGIVSNLGVRHLTFSSSEEVGQPVFGEVYAGTGGMITLSRTASFLSQDHVAKRVYDGRYI